MSNPLWNYGNGYWPKSKSYDFNGGKIEESNSQIIKKIELEKNFGDYVGLDMRTKRFGISPCCSYSELEGSIMNKELCDWDKSLKPVYKREYETVLWQPETEPIPNWVQYGDYDPALGPCIEDACRDFSDPVGSTEFVDFRIDMNIVQQAFTPDGTWDGSGTTTTNAINSSGTAVLYIAAQKPGGNIIFSKIVGKSKVPVGPNDDVLGDGGNLFTDSNGTTFWRIQVYNNLAGTPIVDGASVNEWLKFYIVDGTRIFEVKWGNAVWPTLGGTDLFGDWQVYPAATWGVDGCTACIAQYDAMVAPEFNLECDSSLKECHWCGYEAIYANGTTRPDLEIEKPLGFRCKNQSCITIDVVNQFGQNVQNYPIILNNEDVGSTDEFGRYVINTESDLLTYTGTGNAGTTNNVATSNIRHFTLFYCEFCFIAILDKCYQRHITITIHDDRMKEACTPKKMKLICDNDYPSLEIVDETTPDDTVTSWLCDNDGTNYYGCVEIIGSYGYETQQECIDACVYVPPPTYWMCFQQIGQFGPVNSFCQEVEGIFSGGSSSYETEEECNAGCQDAAPPGCWQCSGAPNFAPEFVEGIFPDGVNCVASLTIFDELVAQGTFCQSPPPYLFQGCQCNQIPNESYVMPNNAEGINDYNYVTWATYNECNDWAQTYCKFSDDNDQDDNDATWVTASIGFNGGEIGTGGAGGAGNASYPVYTQGNIPSTILSEYSSSVFNDIGPSFTPLQTINDGFILVPVFWPNAQFDADEVGYRIGSNMEFTVFFTVDKQPGETSGSAILPLGLNPGDMISNATDTSTDHAKLFYIVNKNNEMLSALSIPGVSTGISTGLTDYYTGNGTDTFADYITMTPTNGTFWNSTQGNSYTFSADFKFNYDLAMSQGGASANQMPLMSGRMFYIPIIIRRTTLSPLLGGGEYNGCNNTLNMNFIDPESGVYVTAADPTTGDALNYQITGGVNAQINPATSGC